MANLSFMTPPIAYSVSAPFVVVGALASPEKGWAGAQCGSLAHLMMLRMIALICGPYITFVDELASLLCYPIPLCCVCCLVAAAGVWRAHQASASTIRQTGKGWSFGASSTGMTGAGRRALLLDVVVLLLMVGAQFSLIAAAEDQLFTDHHQDGLEFVFLDDPPAGGDAVSALSDTLADGTGPSPDASTTLSASDSKTSIRSIVPSAKMANAPNIPPIECRMRAAAQSIWLV